MKLLKKISIGSINGVRGGLKNVKGRIHVMTIGGICGAYKTHVSQNMQNTSYGFLGEFRAINSDGEECVAANAFLPEPAQSLLKAQIDELQGGGNVEFGFRFFAREDETSVVGYVFECEPLMEARPSSALAALTQRLGIDTDSGASGPLALGHYDEDGIAVEEDHEPAPVAHRTSSKGGKKK